MENWAIIIITLITSALFSGMEIAFVSANRLKIEMDRAQGKRTGIILSLFNKRPGRFIGALLIGNNISLVIYGIAIANMMEPQLAAYLPHNMQHQEIAVLLIQTFISTIIVLFTAEFLPKIIFRISPNAALNFFAIPFLIIYYLLYPFTIVFIGFSEWVLKKLFRIKFTDNEYRFGVTDLNHFIQEFSSEDDAFEKNKQELQIVQNVIDFREVKVRECMVPRTEVVALEKNTPIPILLNTFHDTGHSRIMIYEESIDNIIGYAHVSEMFKNPQRISQILHPPIIVPETMLGQDVLKVFIQKRKNIALVVDEFGGTAGIVSIEDVIEEIFGEIRDEHDQENLIEQEITEKEYLFSARLEIDYLNEQYRFQLPESEEYETLGGLIINHHQDIPELDEQIHIGSYCFTIVAKEENKVELVKMILS